jgi:hypothetical protein
LPGPEKRHFLGLVRQPVLLLEGAVMLFVENDQSRIAQRQQQGRTCARDNGRGIGPAHAPKSRLPDRRRLIAMVKKRCGGRESPARGMVQPGGQGGLQGPRATPGGRAPGQTALAPDKAGLAVR